MAIIEIPFDNELVNDETVDITPPYQDDDVLFSDLNDSFEAFLLANYQKSSGEAAIQTEMIEVTLGTNESIGDFYWTKADGSPLDDGVNGTPALDQNGDPITTLDGEALYLWNTTDPRIAIAKTADGDVVAAFFIDQTGDTTANMQMVTFEPLAHPDETDADDRIQWGDQLTVAADKTLEFTFDNLDSGKFLYVGVGSADGGLLCTGSRLNLKTDGTRESGGQTASDAVNTSQGGAGATIGIDNQMFTPGDSAMFSLVKGMDALSATGQTTGQDVDDILYDDFLDTGSLELFISQKQGNTKLDLTLTMYTAGGEDTDAEAARDYIGDENISGNTVGKSSAFTDDDPVAVREVVISGPDGAPIGTWTTDLIAAGANPNDTLYAEGTPGAQGIVVDIKGTGNHIVDINGVDAHYSIKVSAAGNSTFNRFELQADAGKFDIGKIVLQEGEQIRQTVAQNIFTDDDGPVASGDDHTEAVVEDALTGGNADGVSDTASAAITFAELSTLVDVGADAPAVFSLNNAVSGAVTLSDADSTALLSKGDAVTWAYHADDPGDPNDVETISGVAGTRTVFTLVSDGSGGFTFTLLDQVDHGAGGDEETLSVDLTPAIAAHDSDDDPATGLSKALLVTIENDIPVFDSGNVYGQVHEDALAGGNSAGEGTKTVTSTLDGADIAALFSVGADEDLSLSLDDAVSGAVKTKDGDAVLSAGAAVVWAVISGVTSGVVLDENDAVARTVFTLEASGDDYVFTLLDQLDHSGAEDDAENLELDLTPAFAAEDFDGDPADLSEVEGAVTMKVENDLAYIGSQISGGVVDWAAGQTVSGSLNGLPGADQPASYIIDYAEDLSGYIEEGIGTSEVKYYIDLGNDVKGDLAFSLALDDTNTIANPDDNSGMYTFTNHLAAPQRELIFNFDNLPSGQNLFGLIPNSENGVEDLDGTGLLVIGNNVVLHPDGTFTNASNTINTSQGGIGATIGVNNQMFDPSESAVFVYIRDPDDDAAATNDAGVPDSLDQNSADDADTIGYQGTVEVHSAKCFVSQTQGGGAKEMKLTALDIPNGSVGDHSVAAEAGRDHDAQTLYDDLANQSDGVEITSVTVYNGTQKIAVATKGAGGVTEYFDLDEDGNTTNDAGDRGGITVTFNSDGTANVLGFRAGHWVEFSTPDAHDAVRITGVQGKWDIGSFSLKEGQDTPDLEIDFSVAVEDADDDLFSGAGTSYDDFTIRVDGTGIYNEEPEDAAPTTPVLIMLGGPDIMAQVDMFS